MTSPDWKDNLAFLFEQDRTDPFNVIQLFCSGGSPFEMRLRLFEVFRATMYSHYFEDDDVQDKRDRIWLLQMTIRLAETAYYMHKLIKEGRLTYTIKTDKV